MQVGRKVEREGGRRGDEARKGEPGNKRDHHGKSTSQENKSNSAVQPLIYAPLPFPLAPITKRGEIDYESIVKLTDGFNCADIRNVCTEAGLFAIRAGRDYVLEEDFMKASRKLMDAKKLEGKLEYSKYVGWEGGREGGREGRREGRREGTREGRRLCLLFNSMNERFHRPMY